MATKKRYVIGLWPMMYMDAADEGADDGAEDVYGRPDDGRPMMYRAEDGADEVQSQIGR